MGQYICSVCGYVYDEARGIPEAGIAPGTSWGALPEDWVCPICGAAKSEFDKQGEPSVLAEKKPVSAAAVPEDMQSLSALQLSALCTNLARGCEKQYKPEESALFHELAEYFKAASAPVPAPDFDKLLTLIENDLGQGIPAARDTAAAAHDRGALRALVWSEKATRMVRSLLARYQKEGDAMLQNTGVYVCTICGFIYLGDAPPEICPVCKVPSWKFEKVEGRE